MKIIPKKYLTTPKPLEGHIVATLDITALEELVKGNETAKTLLPKAIEKIKSGEVIVVGVSGKKGSGKDSISAALASMTGKPFIISSFAKELKSNSQEMFDVIGVMHSNGSTEDMIVNTLIVQNELWSIPFITPNMHKLVQGVVEDYDNGIEPNAWKRSPGAWRGLQILGTDIRRRQDDRYWVKKTVEFILEQLVNGVSVFISDARFINEIKAMESLGATTIRMNVSKEVQFARLSSRDGSTPSAEALLHPSETELDDYVFDYSIDNDGDGTIEEHASFLLSKIM